MTTLTSPKTYVGLAIFHAVDAAVCAIPVQPVTELLDDLQLGDRPGGVRMEWVLAIVKTAAAIGLGSVYRFPGLARVTTAMLTLYFTIAVSLHIRQREHASAPTRLAGVLAAGFLAACAAMTVKGPARHA